MFRFNCRQEEKHSEELIFGGYAAAVLAIGEEPFVIVARRYVSCINEQRLSTDTVHQYDIGYIRRRHSSPAVRNPPPSILHAPHAQTRSIDEAGLTHDHRHLRRNSRNGLGTIHWGDSL